MESLVVNPKDYEDWAAWLDCEVEDLWVYDKLILSRKLGYECGPVGTDVPRPGRYVVRPITNMLGMGKGATLEALNEDTDFLPTGYFWCEEFKGRHLSVDYIDGVQVLCVEGFLEEGNDLVKWKSWEQVKDQVSYPSILGKTFHHVNCEFIGDKLIEVHLRLNPDFINGYRVIFPVWEGESIVAPKGFKFIPAKDHTRQGFFVINETYSPKS
jgi:hypothetical protein